jgi:UPF0755 protein
MKRYVVPVIIIVIVTVFYFFAFAAPGGNAKVIETERFVIPQDAGRSETLKSLADGGFIKSSLGLNIALLLRGKLGAIAPGGYKISKGQNAFGIAGVLSREPYMKWAVIPEGSRKEQIAVQLAQILDWGNQTKNDFLNYYFSLGPDYKEGVYFPDTYLLPKDETGGQIAKRFIDKFNEKFQPFAGKFSKENIKWTTAVKIASLVQREAAGENDMPLISGIIWNRLLKGIPLAVDATIQYAKGGSDDDYWMPLVKGDTKLDSPYNTYIHKGLPPTPIANPGLPAILAVLNPAKTNCLYYLHDSRGVIHCSVSYTEHQANIEKYLK